MNETQLHARLSELADELAPDADPYAQASGARMLHRRQLRTRAGLAGLAAAIAAVVVGVPLGIGALSSDPGADVAAPSTTEETPVYAGDPALRSLVEQLDAELGDGALVALPDMSASERAALSDGPCPQAAELLSDRLGLSLSSVARASFPGPTIGTGCSYSRLSNNNGPDRLALGLSSSPDEDGWLVDPTDIPAGCATATLPDSARTYVLLCRGEVPSVPGTYADQLMWRLVVPDTTGEFWGLTALVGTGYPDRTGIDAVIALWDVVQGEFSAGGSGTAGPDGPSDEHVAQLAELLADSYPDMSAVPVVADPFCPATPAALQRAGFGDATGSLNDGCVWTAEVAEAEPVIGRLWLRSDFGMTDIGCPTAAVPGWTPGTVLRGCPDGRLTSWELMIPTYDGSGAWSVTASGGVETAPPGESTTLEYRGPSSDALLVTLVGLVQTR